jgi:hypothetical protein
MSVSQPHHTPEELARLGSDAFDRHVRPKLRSEDDDRFVAIDIISGDHEIDEDDYTAVMRLRARCPTAEIWLGRIGEPAAYRMRQVQ